ncbi:PDZ domain-containing protein [Comamonas sp. JC664]|uniref:PDZ domain-containing protein n=1 Tax=Comamonas sp. JC664 TaxID=2801917 RepID=UPI00191F0487|nr:PDZ domain-containing protein [Comamonas sp. JC664]MBL0694848.1 PDZ domain-containing protein [Comamonas sp. JC664]GHG94886.1 hypothetical protein GCM10012319_58240 [Comamonas sp. KCTC 72670]
MELLHARREALIAHFAQSGAKLLTVAARRLPTVLTRPVLEGGSRVLQDTAFYLQEATMEELLNAAQKKLKEQPGSSLLGLLGIGLLTGRLLRKLAKKGGAESFQERLRKSMFLATHGGVGRPPAAARQRLLRGEAGGAPAQGGVAEGFKERLREGMSMATHGGGVGRPPAATRLRLQKAGGPKAGVKKSPPSPEEAPSPKAPTPASGGYLGMGAIPVRLPEKLAKAHGTSGGLKVASVEPEGPAEEAGLHPGDTLLTLEGQPLREVDDLVAQLPPERVGQTVHAKVLRAGAARDVDLTVGAHP